MAIPSRSFDVPYNEPVVKSSGLLSDSWTNFFRSLYDLVFPLGTERAFQLANNQIAPTDIEGLSVSARAISYAHIEYLIQRVTTSTGATELIESGAFELIYRPTDEEWVINVIAEETPDDAGVALTVTTAGQVQYTTTNITGTASLSRIVWRTRTLSAKSSLYSTPGARA